MLDIDVLNVIFPSRGLILCNVTLNNFIHGAKPIHPKEILILGGGFAGVEVLRRLQDRFQNDVSVNITMVSKDKFFLFTPMLHEVVSGMIETRHIVTPIRAFCNRDKFYVC